MKQQRDVKLREGDKVLRCVLDGDFVFVNRQPTLTRASVMVLKVIVSRDPNFHAIGVNSLVLQLYAGDCDGDEINIYCPIDNDIGGESHVYDNLRSDKDGSFHVNLHGDLMLGIFKMCRHSGFTE